MTTADSGPIHAESHGDGSPLVFVHGAWVSSEMWEPQVERFAGDHRVVTLDVRGHGRSAPTDRRDYSVDLFTEDLRAVLTELGVESPVLCGLSLGGLVAQSYALEYPDVRGLVLANTVRSVPPIPMTGLQKRLLFPKFPLYSTIRMVGARRWFRMLLCGVESTYGRRWLALDDDARRYALGEVDGIADREFVKIYDALYDFDPLPVSDIDAPTVLVHGDHETPTVRAQNRSMRASIDDATQVTIPDAGHLSNLDNPAAFNAAVESFLARVGA